MPGDIIRLETGSVVPADCRVVESVNLRVQEAALTGESEPVEKIVHALRDPDLTIGDRRNMAYLRTFATFGRGLAVVVATGMATELGKIATMIQAVRHEPTPLQKRLDALGKILAVIAVVIAAFIVGAGLPRGEDVPLMLLTGVSLAVAIVPEGLPAVLTFTLALGAKRMLARKALIRKLPAVETLGSVTVICSDKTGTRTQNQMTVTRLETASAGYLALVQLGRVMSTRSFSDPVIALNVFSNRVLVAMIAIALALQIVAVYLPIAQPFFHTQALPIVDLAVGAGIALTVLLAMEAEKWVRSRGSRAEATAL